MNHLPLNTMAGESATIGKAAHITAAAAGGPRYDPTQTSAERRSIHNGIWVCASCGDIIDRDEAEYPVEMLHQLKTAAEQLARDRVGRQRQSGPPVPKTHADIRQAIELFCLSEAARYARLDPRFNVSVGWANDAPVYELHAKEPVPATFAIGTKDAERFSGERSIGSLLGGGCLRIADGAVVVNSFRQLCFDRGGEVIPITVLSASQQFCHSLALYPLHRQRTSGLFLRCRIFDTYPMIYPQAMSGMRMPGHCPPPTRERPEGVRRLVGVAAQCGVGKGPEAPKPSVKLSSATMLEITHALGSTPASPI